MKYIFLLSIVFMALACKKNNKLQSEKDDEILQQYISDKGLTATKTASGLYVVITNPGTGGSCSATSNVKVAYKVLYHQMKKNPFDFII